MMAPGWTTWLRRRFLACPRGARRPGVRPCLESLENRTAPAVFAVIAPAGLAALAGANLGNGDIADHSPRMPASIIASTGSGQHAVVDTLFDSPLVVLVRDRFGHPVPGVAVLFARPGAGTAAVRSVVTDATGAARLTVAADSTAGAYTVTASLAGVGDVSFDLTNDPVRPVSFVVGALAATDEQDPIGLTVRVLDADKGLATGFRGGVHFSSDDPRASLPADYAFTAADAGAHTFAGVRLLTPGPRTVFVQATGLPGSAVVDVSDAAPTVSLDDTVVPVSAGAPLLSGGRFTDRDGANWTATVDYGDGKGPHSLALGPDRTFRLQKVYDSEGTYKVTVVVTDESGVPSEPASFRVAVFIAGTDAHGVGMARAAPGSTAVAPANGVTGVLDRAADDEGDGVLLVTPLPSSAAGPGGGETTVYDVRGVNLTSHDVVVVTFFYPANGVAPVLRFFDPTTGGFRILPTVVNLADHSATAVLTGDTIPPVTALNGTVFTITVTPGYDVVRPTTSGPTTASRPGEAPNVTLAVVNTLTSAVGLTVVEAVSPAAADGGGGDPSDQDLLGDLPAVKPDKNDATSPPSTAVLSPSQSKLPDKPPSDKKPDKPKPPDSDKPKPPMPPGKLDAPPEAGAGAPVRPEDEGAGRRAGVSLAVDLVLAAGLCLTLPDERRKKPARAQARAYRQKPGEPG